MGGLPLTVVTAGALFAGTNVDDLVVLAILNVSSRAEGRPRAWEIWTGQGLGIAVLVAVSMLAALGLTPLPGGGLWVLGLVPLGMGLYKLGQVFRARTSGTRPPLAVATSLAAVTAVTVSNGGDNVAAYTAVFRTSTRTEIAAILAVFVLGVILWCAAGSLLVSHRRVTESVERWGHWIVPAVFIGIGASVFCKGGLFTF